MSKTNINIHHCHAAHEEGTKAYQTWQIGTGNQWVTIHQWGKSSEVRPGIGTGGQIKMQPFSRVGLASADVREVQNAKAKRGYKWSGTKTASSRPGDLHANLRSMFGPERADGILRNIGDFDVSDEPVEDDTFKSMAKAESEAPVDRGESWATW